MLPDHISENNPTNRIFGKVSFENPKEGLVHLIAAMTGMDAKEIMIDESTLALVEKQANEIREIKQWMNPHYDDLLLSDNRENRKKRLELIDLGKFVYSLNKQNEIILDLCGERPDFTVRAYGKKIGVEMTGIYNEEYVESLNVFKSLVSQCEESIRKSDPHVTGLFNIIIFPSKIKEVLSLGREKIKQSIRALILAKYEEKVMELPEYVHDISSSTLILLELAVGEKIGYAELNIKSLVKTIEKKETKIIDYKNNVDIAECWLLIVIDGISAISNFRLKQDDLPTHLIGFDRIYLFNSFTSEIFEAIK